MPEQATPRQRVQRGAAFLDAINPTWHTEVSLTDLNVETIHDDVFLDATGYTPEDVAEFLMPTDAGAAGWREYGFALDDGEDPMPIAEAWADAIADRQFAEVVSPPVWGEVSTADGPMTYTWNVTSATTIESGSDHFAGKTFDLLIMDDQTKAALDGPETEVPVGT